MSEQHQMVNLSVEETSGVDHPAHLHEGWVILKAADETSVTETIAALMSTEQREGQMTTESTDATVDASTDELAKAQEQIETLNATLAEKDEQIAGMLAKSEDESEEEEAEAEEAEEAEAETEEMTEEALVKSMPEPVREMLEKARNAEAEAREELRKERDAQADREFVAKAGAWKSLSLDAEEFGPMLRQVHDMNETLADIIAKAMDAANAQAESGAIFDEIGKPAPVARGADAYGHVQSLAKAAVEAGEFATVEQAVSQLVAADPSLYEQYLNEMRS